MTRLRERALSLVGVGLLALSAATFAATATSTPAGAAGPASSAVTVRGTGAFPDLQVTVSKTKALANEVVQVDWKGLRPTRGNFAVDYLQLMQCWGDATSGPQREQCQFGGLVGDLRGGAFVSSRQVTYDLRDPLETYVRQADGRLRFVPFRSVTGKTREAGLSEFFDASTTNEVPYARNRADGAGTLPFEVQTSAEAPGLGCGVPRPATGASTPRAPGAGAVANPGLRCWLVAVPRGDTEVDGSTRTQEASRQLLSSPLSQTNWNARVVVPLDFAKVGEPCPLGRAERAVVGHEDVAEAVASWQPALCSGDGPVFSYGQIADTLARRIALGDAAGLSIVTRPIPTAQVPSGRTPTYAPVALSGFGVAFNIDSISGFSAPAEVKARDGQRIAELKLTPRLVAKLLTQSYKVAAAQDRAGLERNPLDLTRDKEFQRHNPAFAGLSYTGIGSVVVPAGLSDAAGQVWEWLLGDPDARAFLAGTPDPDGMVVNPAYKGTGPQDGFPKSDEVCATFTSGQPPLCTLDAFPYAGDTHEAARGAARGDTLSRSNYDQSAAPPAYKRSLPQPTGARSVLALTDTATAARFGLPMASLANASGAFVAPTVPNLLASLAVMRPSEVPVVLEADLTSKAPAAYPLTNLSYAVTSAGVLDAGARRDYAAFLRHAVGAGQVPDTGIGGLPAGYAPLPPPLRALTAATAARLGVPQALASPPPTGAGPPTSTTTTTTTTTTGGAGPGQVGGGDLPVGPASDGTGTLAPPTTTGAGDPLEPGTVPAGPAGPAGAPVPVTLPGTTLAVASPTPADEVGVGRYGVVLTLALGGLAALGGSLLRRTAGTGLVPRPA